MKVLDGQRELISSPPGNTYIALWAEDISALLKDSKLLLPVIMRSLKIVRVLLGPDDEKYFS
jgi:hypothetical protein